MDSIKDLLSFLSSNIILFSALAASLSIITTIISMLSKLKDRKEILESVESQKIENILKTDDKEILGQYLETSLEKINIAEYSTSESVSKNVDSYLKQIQSYLGKSEEIIEPTEIEEHISLKEKPFEEFPEVPENFKPILVELKSGESWNALARLRRYIEIYLRQIVESKNIKIEKVSSAGNLLKHLENEKQIDPDFAGILKYVLSVSNKAVHGFDISQDEAEKAIRNAIYVLFGHLNSLK